MIQQQSTTAEQLLAALEQDPEYSEFLKKSLRFVCEPPSAEELKNVQFEIQKIEDLINAKKVDIKSQASSYRKKQKEKIKNVTRWINDC